MAHNPEQLRSDWILLVRRIEASVTTFFPCLLLFFVAGLLLGPVIPIDRAIQDAYGLPQPLAKRVVLACIGLVILLAVTIDGAPDRATYGMRKRGLCLLTRDGKQVSFLQWCPRVWLGVACLPLAPLSAVVILCDLRGRSLSDLACGTKVVLTFRSSRQ